MKMRMMLSKDANMYGFSREEHLLMMDSLHSEIGDLRKQIKLGLYEPPPE